MRIRDVLMGSAGSARPQVNVESEITESSDDPDFEPGTHFAYRSYYHESSMQAAKQLVNLLSLQEI